MTLHALIFLLLVVVKTAPWLVNWLPTPAQPPLSLVEPVPEVEQVIEVPPIEVVPAPEPPTQTYVRSDGLKAADRPPETGSFISDANTQAASRLPSTPGADPDVPTQEGLDFPIVEVVKSQFVDGEDKPPAPLAAQTPAPPTPPSDPAPPTETADAVPAEPAAPPPAPTPPPPEEMAATTPDGPIEVRPPDQKEKTESLKLTEPDENVRPPERTEPKPKIAETRPTQAKPPAPPPRPASAAADVPRAQSERVKTKIDGGAAQEDQESVAAADTPSGRYMKAVTGAVEKEWRRKRSSYADFVSYGIIRLEFNVTRQGKVRDLRILNRNGANAVMQNFTLNAVLDAAIPPMPADLPEFQNQDLMKISYNIVVY